MTFEVVRSFAAAAGLIIFMILFAAMLIYTFWPGNRKRFEEAGRIPLQDDSDPSSARGENGH